MTHWPFVGALSILAFWLRTAPRYHQVLGIPGFVNFTETDAWFHVRIIQQMVHNFPHRLTLDPYGRIDGGQSVDTGIFFDTIPAFIGWIAGLSDLGIHQLAAWYPAILGALLVPATFLCGRSIFNQKAGLWAAAVVATLPGHFLHTGSLGFTDHHVMEALLTTLLLYLLSSNAHPLLLGATLTAYLLTFAGGAFVVALITIWYWLEAARGNGISSRNFALACLMAAPFTLWQQHVYLMRYSLAAVLLAAAGLWLLPAFARWCQRQTNPRATYFALSALTTAAALALLSFALPGQESLFAVIKRLTASSPLADTVTELQSLTRVKGFFSLEYPWREFGGAFVFTLIALPLLAEACWKKPNPQHLLFLLWAVTFFIMAMTQARMTYYFGVSAALLSGYLMSQLPTRSLPALALGAFLILPNLSQAARDTAALPGQISPDWREALTYLRDRTPDLPNSSVLAWWDSGYWISTFAHRIPVTNPTQNNAAAAANFLLATEEPAAREALTKAHAQYVVLDHQLPFVGDESSYSGIFLNLFPYTDRYRVQNYVFDVRDESRRRLFFRAKYFETMLVRLFLAGGQFVRAENKGPFAVVEVKGQQLIKKRQFPSLLDAKAAALCDGCEVVSESPLAPCIDLEPVALVEYAFASSSAAVRQKGTSRAQVQIYKVR